MLWQLALWTFVFHFALLSTTSSLLVVFVCLFACLSGEEATLHWTQSTNALGGPVMTLDTKSSIMKHVTVTRILLIAILGCAAVSVHFALQTRNEWTTLCVNALRIKADDYDTTLSTVSSPSVLSTTLNRSNFELSSTKRDYNRGEPHRNVIRTLTAGTVQTNLKSTTVQMPSSYRGQSSVPFHVLASVYANCNLPLFCSSKLIRNCVSSEIIGLVPDALRTQRLKSPKSILSVETSHTRRQSFKNVFDSRAWGHSWDLQNRGLNASGK